MLRRKLDPTLTTAIFLGLAATAFMMVRVDLPPWSHIVSALSVVLFALPTLLALKLWLGLRDGLRVFGALAVFAVLIETLAITTGFPYGHFNYSGHLGFKLFDLVPWTVAFAWPPLMLGAYAAAANLSGSLLPRATIATLLMVAFDLVLDPGAVYLGFWNYAEGGWFYGVPASNFAGWAVSGLAGAVLVEALVRFHRPLLPVPVQLLIATEFIIVFWTAIAVFTNLFLAAVAGLAVLVLISFIEARRGYDFDDMLVLVDEQNNPIGTAPKLATHDSETPLHRAFSVFVFDRRGRLLLQQRAMSKKTWPGVWSNSCCGHVMLHESTEDAAERRLRYELGLKGIKLSAALPDFRYRAEKDGVVENEFCPVYVGMIRGELKPNPSEVASTEWMDWDDFLDRANDPATEISPWAIEEAQLLASDAQFREWFAMRVAAEPAS